MNPELSNSGRQLDNNSEAEAEYADSFFSENEEDYVGVFQEEQKLQKQGIHLAESKDNFESFDDGFIKRDEEDKENDDDDDEEEEEEEEESHDLKGYGFSSQAYDSAGYQDERLTYEERQEMIEKLEELQDDSRVLMIANKFLHKNYINAMRNSASFSHTLEKFDETIVYEDSRYQATLEKYVQARMKIKEKRESVAESLQNLEETYAFDESAYTEILENLITRELSVAKRMRPRNLTKELWLFEVDELLKNQGKRFMDVTRIRLTYVRLHRRLEKLQNDLKKCDSLGPEFSMMDYEHLLKRKDVYKEKRDEQFEQMKKFEYRNLACAASILHVHEDTSLFNEKVHEKTKQLNILLDNIQSERYKAVEFAKEKVSLTKHIKNLKEDMGLLNCTFLLKKMQTDINEITKWRRRIESLEKN